MLVVSLGLTAPACGGGVHNDKSTEASSSTRASPSGTTTTTTTTSSSATSSDGPSTTATTACNFVCTADLPRQDCDTFEQDCDPGFKCIIFDPGGGGWDGRECVEIMGDGQHGDTCTFDDDSRSDTCALGHMCVPPIGQEEGVCVAMCKGSPEEPLCLPPLTICPIHSGGTGPLCQQLCDPLVQDCPEGELCTLSPNSLMFQCEDDNANGAAPEGTPCERANDCNPGLFCASRDFYPAPGCQGSFSCCAPFCDLNAVDPCAGLSVPDAECVAWDSESPLDGLEHVGVCGLPQ